jgi:hypothetical protein
MNKRRYLVLIIIIVFALTAGISVAQESEEEDGDSGIIPVTIDVTGEEEGEADGTEEIEEENGEETNIDDETTDVEEEGTTPEEVEPWTVSDSMLREIAKVETFTDEDGNTVVYYYNSEDKILEKAIFICPPREVLEGLLQEKMIKAKEAFPGGNYTFKVPGSDKPVYEDEEDREVEIEGLETFEEVDVEIQDTPSEETDVEEGMEEETMDVAVFDDESEETPIEVNGDDLDEEILIDEFKEEEKYMVEDNIIPGPGKYYDNLKEKYTIYKPEQSYIESLLVREAYEAGRIAIIVAQDVKINWESIQFNEDTEKYEGTYECNFRSSRDSYHYLDGILITKFEVRKGTYKVMKYDTETGNILTERIHQYRAGNSYDLYVYHTNGDLKRQEIYYNGKLAYSTTPESNFTRFENVSLTFDFNGNLNTMDEVILKDLEETINQNIVTVDFSIYDVPNEERVKYSEIGHRKTYYDNWEMVTKVELYQFGGEVAVIRYYGLNGMLIREERYEDNRLYSTIVFSFDEMGFISRINYIDVFGDVYKYKEGDSFYNAQGKEISEDEFKALKPDYDFSHVTEIEGGDNFYTELQNQITGYEEEEMETDEEDVEEVDTEEEEIEEGLEEEEE